VRKHEPSRRLRIYSASADGMNRNDPENLRGVTQTYSC
jgi:hypothetical protein